MLVALCVATPAHAAQPIAWLDAKAPIQIGIGVDLSYTAAYDATAVPFGAKVTVTRGDDGRLHIFHPGVHILTRTPWCTGGHEYAHCQGEFNGIEAQLGPGDDTWTPARAVHARVNGGAGADLLQAPANVGGSLSGGPGADRIVVLGRGTSAFGGDGDDRVEAPNGGFIDGDGGDDVLIGGATRNTFMDGGAGNDVLTGGSDTDFLTGGAGDDSLDARGGDDELTPGTGTDDVLGGPGRDRARYPDHPAAVDLSLDGLRNDGAPGENDLLDSIEDLDGSVPLLPDTPAPGDDRITADDGPNRINLVRGAAFVSALAGDDLISGAGTFLAGDGDDKVYAFGGMVEGGAGADTIVFDGFIGGCYRDGCHETPYSTEIVRAGPGDDTIEAAFPFDEAQNQRVPDSKPDDIACGDGWDTVTADLEDTVALDCEVVTRR
jgi:Ca2+-binding RTX toxin-like protein